MPWFTSQGRHILVGTLSAVLLIAGGCKRHEAANQPAPAPEEAQPAPRSDLEIAGDVKTRIKGETALDEDAIHVDVVNGAVTLNGTVDNDAARALAAHDAGAVNGVKTVINNLTVTAPKVPTQTATPAEERLPRRHRTASMENRTADSRAVGNRPGENDAYAHPAGAQDTAQTQAPPQTAPEPPSAPATPPPPPAPTPITVAAGATVPVRIADALSSESAQAGQTFGGRVSSDVVVNGQVAIPKGATVSGRIVNVQDAAHFKGNALLSLELISVRVQGQQYPLSTNAWTQQGQARGKNTMEKSGGGAALGALIGALAGGGKGAAIGAIAGGGAGAGANAITRGQQVKVPAETVINFQLQSPVTVMTTPGAPAQDNGTAPQLQPR
jgi:hypothetical protein